MCKVGEALSTVIEITCGVPHGSILGPLLFLIHVYDMPAVSKIMLYADDSILLLSGKYTRVIHQTLSRERSLVRVHCIWQ